MSYCQLSPSVFPSAPPPLPTTASNSYPDLHPIPMETQKSLCHDYCTHLVAKCPPKSNAPGFTSVDKCNSACLDIISLPTVSMGFQCILDGLKSPTFNNSQCNEVISICAKNFDL